MQQAQQNVSSNTPDELTRVQQKLYDNKNISESYIVGCLYQNPDLIYDYDTLTLEDFRINKWKVYFEIIKGMKNEKFEHIDELEINLYLEKHQKLREVYDNTGGWETIQMLSSEYVNADNIESYIDNNNKWEALYRKIESGQYITEKQFSTFIDMTYDEIYDYYDYLNNNSFVKASNNLKGYDLSDGIDDTIQKLFSDEMVGLPYYEMPFLTQLTNGCSLGDITGLGAPTGVGKSTFMRNVYIASLINYGEPAVIFINEESRQKWQIEFIAWVINNVFKKDIAKGKMKYGSSLTAEQKQLIIDAGEWLKKMKDQELITIVPVDVFNCKEVIRRIKQYASKGVKYYAIDTFKEDGTEFNDNEWELLRKNMTNIYDVIKPENKNLHIFCTLQLRTADVRQRYLTKDNTAGSKAMANVMSVYLMIRRMFDDEKPLENPACVEGKTVADIKASSSYKRNKAELDVVTLVDGKHVVPVAIDPAKDYLLVFIVKNRNGEAEKRQIVIEADYSRNIFKEVGYTLVPFS